MNTLAIQVHPDIKISENRAILNDKETYGPDVEHFNPERFLKDGELNEDVRYPDTAYGFGRRICPGRNLADEQMFITFASVLAAFDVTKAVDESGNSIAPEVYYTTGVIRYVCWHLYVIRRDAD